MLPLLILLSCTPSAPELPKPPSFKAMLDGTGMVHPEPDAESLAKSAPPTRDANQAQLLINGEAAFSERLRLLRSAEASIYIQALIWKGDATGRALANELLRIKAERPEVDIRVIVDAYANIQDVRAQLMYFELQQSGIEVEGFEALYLHWYNDMNLADLGDHNKRFHEKYFIVDGREAVVGGMNIADEYARCTEDPMLLWRDQDVLLRGPVVDDIQAAFLDNFAWFKEVKSSKPALFDPDAYWSAWRAHNLRLDELILASMKTHRALKELLRWRDRAECDREPVISAVHKEVSVRFLRSRPRVEEDHIHEEYLRRIAAAKRSVLIENAYFVPVPELKAVLSRAAQRGVAVTVLTNSDATNDIGLITKAGRAHYLELIEAGVEVREWRAHEHGEGTVHSKIAVFDDEVALIGSYNLDPRSRALNSEDAVIIEDAAVAGELAAWVRERDLPWSQVIVRAQAEVWADPASLPQVEEQPLWLDPRFDPQAFEYLLIRQIEGAL